MQESLEAGEAENIHSTDAAANDLTETAAQSLRKLSDKDARIREQNGNLYAHHFRQLQIKPEKYYNFYDRSLRVLRNKHIDLLKRGSPASIRQLTDLFVRGNGYLVWTENSIWQLDNSELDNGEIRLTYQRRAETPNLEVENPRSARPSRSLKSLETDNPRLYPIFTDLWTLMRNTIFELKPKAQGRHHLAADDLDSDADHYADAASPDTTTQERVRPTLQSRTMLQSVAAGPGRSEYETIALRRPLTTDEAEAAILDLITHFHIIRSASDIPVFDELFAQQLARVEELETAEGVTTQSENFIPPQDSPEPSPNPSLPQDTQFKSLSNEPFMTTGNPLKPLQQLLPPTIPSMMSIYICSARASPYLTTSHLTSTDLTSAVALRSTSVGLSASYHWPAAPVTDCDMTRFFGGVNNRIADPLDTIVGYMFSYGWNDTCRFVSSGLQELAVQKRIKVLGANPHQINLTDGSGDRMDIDSPVDDDMFNIDQENHTRLVDRHRQKWEPELEQWQYIRLGWADFQNDITHAARLGVSVWRMKVCVLTLSQCGK